MPFQERSAGAEFGKNFFIGHAASLKAALRAPCKVE
jgi:hypothetical protein